MHGATKGSIFSLSPLGYRVSVYPCVPADLSPVFQNQKLMCLKLCVLMHARGSPLILGGFQMVYSEETMKLWDRLKRWGGMFFFHVLLLENLE